MISAATQLICSGRLIRSPSATAGRPAACRRPSKPPRTNSGDEVIAASDTMLFDEFDVPPAKELVHPTPAVRLQSLDISESSKIRSVSEDSDINSGNKRKSADDSMSNSTSQSTFGTSKSRSDAVSDRESSNSGALSKKRALGRPLPKKREFSVSPVPLPPVLIDPLPGLALLNQIQAKSISIATKCASLGTSVGLRLEDLFLNLEKETISHLVAMLNDCRRRGHLVDGGFGYRSAAYLLAEVTKAYPSLRSLPQGISSLIKEMNKLVLELLQSYIDSAINYVPDAGVQQPTEGVSDADIDPRPEPSMPMLGKSPAQTAEKNDATPPKTADN